MVKSDRPAANGFVSFMRKIYNPIGFSKGYNAILWFIFDGALFGFILARLEYLDLWGVFCKPGATAAAPGECYWYTNYDRNKIGLIIHLAAILPAGFLAVFQFVPFIRHKALLYHRIAGWIIVLLVLVGNGAAVSIANHAFGGDNFVRMFVGILSIISTLSLGLAIYNIKRVQIEQHRAWMLRTWFYLASIITLRIIMILMTIIATTWGGEAQAYTVMPCAEILFINNGNTNQTYAHYPACDPSASEAYRPDGMAVVRADFAPVSGTGSGVTVGAALETNFGAAGLLALVLHAIGVEIYLRLTPREGERLRQVSYERQLERGFANPGSAGLVVEKLGDADPWVPSGKRKPSEVTLAGDAVQEVETKGDVSPPGVSV